MMNGMDIEANMLLIMKEKGLGKDLDLSNTNFKISTNEKQETV